MASWTIEGKKSLEEIQAALEPRWSIILLQEVTCELDQAPHIAAQTYA